MSNSLPTQAEIDAINQAYDAVEACYQQGLTNAIACGKLLKAAKKKVEHGEWLSWLKANCPKAERTAADYMWLATKEETGDLKKAADQISKTHADLSDLSITKVKELLPRRPQTEAQKAATERLVAANKAKAATAQPEPASPDLISILKRADVDQVLVALKAEWDLAKLNKLAAALDEYVEEKKVGTAEAQPTTH